MHQHGPGDWRDKGDRDGGGCCGWVGRGADDDGEVVAVGVTVMGV